MKRNKGIYNFLIRKDYSKNLAGNEKILVPEILKAFFILLSMKKFVIIILFILLSPTLSAEKIVVPMKEKKDTISIEEFFTPEDITLADDAFHVFPLHVEDWYYEAFFNNNYSIVLIVTILSNGAMGIALTGFYIYNNGHLEYTDRIVTLSPFFSVSEKKPLIKIFGEEIINGDSDEMENLCYAISFEKDGYGLSLTFINETKGWKGKMGRGWWLAVPRCKVEGNLILGGEVVDVTGKGYHDHNIFLLSTPLLERGYIDGKLLDDSFSIVWGNIFHTRWHNDTFAIMSKDGRYFSIPQEKIVLREDSYICDHGRFIPTEVYFSFNITNEIRGFLYMKAEDFHHIRLPFLWYWRYHVIVEGKVKIGKDEKEIKNRDMVELMIY